MKKSRYRCLYCGTGEFSPTVPSWELKKKRCKVCDHDKFSVKALETGDYFGYGDEEKKEEPGFPWVD